MLLKAEQHNNIHTLNCFPIITKEPENIGPIISIQKMNILRCQTSDCTKSSYFVDYYANWVEVVGSL